MGRGKEPIVVCDACGRRVPRNKAVEWIKGLGNFDEDDAILNLTGKKVYYCISCAKHRGIFEKKKRLARRRHKW